MESEILLLHFVIFVLLLALTKKLYVVILKGKHNFENCKTSTSDRIHLMDHLIGAGLSAVGAATASAMSLVELTSFFTDTPVALEVPESAAFILLLIGMIYQAWHLEKEETPGHPFYHWVNRRFGKRITDDHERYRGEEITGEHVHG